MPENLVVVISPLRASATRSFERHMQFAKLLCVAAKDAGFLPFASHLYGPTFLDDDVPSDRDVGLKIGRAILRRANEVWVWDLWGISSGMRGDIDEVEEANRIIVVAGLPLIALKYMSRNEVSAWEHLREMT